MTYTDTDRTPGEPISRYHAISRDPLTRWRVAGDPLRCLADALDGIVTGQTYIIGWGDGRGTPTMGADNVFGQRGDLGIVAAIMDYDECYYLVRTYGPWGHYPEGYCRRTFYVYVRWTDYDGWGLLLPRVGFVPLTGADLARIEVSSYWIAQQATVMDEDSDLRVWVAPDEYGATLA